MYGTSWLLKTNKQTNMFCWKNGDGGCSKQEIKFYSLLPSYVAWRYLASSLGWCHWMTPTVCPSHSKKSCTSIMELPWREDNGTEESCKQDASWAGHKSSSLFSHPSQLVIPKISGQVPLPVGNFPWPSNNCQVAFLQSIYSVYNWIFISMTSWVSAWLSWKFHPFSHGFAHYSVPSVKHDIFQFSVQ